MGDHMRSEIRKLASAILVAAMVLPVISCGIGTGKGDDFAGAKNHSGLKIGKDTPWYESSEYKMEKTAAGAKKVDYYYDDFIGCDDKYICCCTAIEYAGPGSSGDGEPDRDSIITLIDRNTGETVRKFDTKTVTGDEFTLYNVIYRKGLVEGLVSAFNRSDGTYRYKEVKIDPDTEKIVGERDIQKKCEDRSTYDVGDYRIDEYSEFDRYLNPYTVMEITSPDGSRKTVELRQGEIIEYMCPYFFMLGKTKVLFPSSITGEDYFYIMDLETGKYTKADAVEYEWLRLRSANGTFIGKDGYTYICNGTGVYKADMEKKALEEVFNYSWCDQSSHALAHLHLADVSGDTFFFCGNVFNEKFGFYGGTIDMDIKLISLKKAGKNPHAGKRVLEMYAPYGKVDENIYAQVVKFNNTNGKYFIEITDRYTQETTLGIDATGYDEDTERQAYLNFGNALGNKLSMDILNGQGPDIFLNADYFGPLNYKENLADLTPYLGELPADKYFTNIIDLAKKDGKIYNLPLTFTIDGIQTNPRNAGKSGTGFTTAEYEKFLKEQLNGEDIIIEGQPYYFLTLFNAMSDKFIANGKADFTGEEFAALAQYVRDNVLPKSSLYDYDPYPSFDDIINSTYNEMKPAYRVNFDTYAYYFEAVERVDYDPVFLGLPSADGRGPSATPGYSIAVSSHAASVDACGEFVKMLLEGDVQYGFAKNGRLPVNREAFRKVGPEAVDFFNSVSINDAFIYGFTPKNRKTFTADHIDALEKTILSCSVMASSDPDIDKILVEEMPAYFTGQKSLDDVVKIAQNRVQKVLDERG